MLLLPSENTGQPSYELLLYNLPVHKLTVFCPQRGWTALHLAAQEGQVDVERLLTEAKAHINIQTEVHRLCHVWSTDLDSQFPSVDRGENMYIQGMLCAYMFFCRHKHV